MEGSEQEIEDPDDNPLHGGDTDASQLPHHHHHHLDDLNGLEDNVPSSEKSEDDDGIAYGEAAPICAICGRGDEDGRPILRFLPVEHDLAAATASPSVDSFTQDIALHIFCGKTASILPGVNQPELEILTKAGLKNKHGIGPEVNAALARTRCAILAEEGAKEKHFYLVREFEAHLAAIRHTRITYIPGAMQDLANEFDGVPTAFFEGQESLSPPQVTSQPQPEHEKTIPIRAAAGQVHKHRQVPVEASLPVNVTKDGKIRCGCGGTHLPTGTPRGVQSWRSHVLTKRHQKWMEENGMLGAV